ncbi:radical SAM protein [Parabacteroides distasonis]|uniref:radical SAM/SPASM domain-containing protein n=1 Tax=Parabacteroides distasonis TaxID=823 RepID=UPI00189A122E|nr:radical SAM protein [Parabacteroides distasonis]MDB8998101.1 radical SAM protein [Parabacteroides distasonis]MDB9072794.1 radical SAM protein [Parabacteroides distasonis]
MKESNYNIYVPVQDKVICFNTLNNIFTIITEADYRVLRSDILNLRDNLRKRLEDNKFIIADYCDEYEQIEARYQNKVNSSVYDLTILPTLDCNLRCWYCFETHVMGSRLSTVTQDNILKFTQNILNSEEITALSVTLFGGEPLLYFKEELYPLLKRIRDYAITVGKLVNFSFITNGVCIDESFIPMLRDLNAGFQISIDGYREKHNTVKKGSGVEQSYDIVMKVIHLLHNSYNPYINLRINYDNQTLLHIEEVIKDIVDIDRSHIRIHLERVWQTRGGNHDGELLKKAITLFLINGFRVSYLNLNRDGDSCKASEKNQAVISYNGIVYKCSGRDFTKDLEEGVLSDEGCINWNIDKLNKRLSLKTFDNERCIKCKMLPLCWGPCCQKILEGRDSRSACQLDSMEISLSDYVLFEFNSCIIENNIKQQEMNMETV